MENYEQKKEKSPMEITDDVLEQVSGGISDVDLNPENVYGDPIEPGKEMMSPIRVICREGNYGTETEKIV